MSTFAHQSLLLLLLAVPVFGHFGGKKSPAEYFFSKPIVLPAYEGDYHHVMIESDTIAAGGTYTPSFAMVGVLLLDRQFTFSGIDERWLGELKGCFPFYGSSVVKKCSKQYFLLHSDFVDVRKQVLKKQDNIDNFCEQFNTGNGNDKNKFMVRFGRRVLMTYKYDANSYKCIGTYDMEDDQFSCIMPSINPKTKKFELKPFRMDGFLYDPIEGTPHRDDNTVEVFCKMSHKFS